MGAGHAMKRSARFATVIFLAGLVQVSLPVVVSAQNTPWKLKTRVDPITDEPRGTILSSHVDGGHIGFSCDRGNSRSEFLAVASTRKGDKYPEGEIEVAWRIDKGAVRREMWEADSYTPLGGVGLVGQGAYEFALAVARAQKRVVFRNENGTVVFNPDGSAKAISQLLQLCGLKQ